MVTKLIFFPLLMAKFWEFIVIKHKKALIENLNFS